MDQERWRRVSELFEQALAIDSDDERSQWLIEACGNDELLRREVDSLLTAHFGSSDFLGRPALEESTALMGAGLESRWLGRTIGSWKIVKLIHTGGMGSVFLAQRESSGFEQTAALKVIRTELADRVVHDRFVQERQLLARLEHPCISRLLDGGMTNEGLPWLVMEYVDGEPINQWCDNRQLSINDRLKLFEQVCEAVSFAHQKLVIHRDIKPANILVSRDGSPKLLDFGIAKLETTEADSQRTITSQRVLTPAYASPEQFMGKAITTASDIYSLGMLLYELLTGSPPYRIEQTQSALEQEDIICRRTPESPSQQLRTTRASDSGGPVSAGGRMSRDQLRRELRGDLDVIVMKTLRKEPERRYASVDALREDLRRYRQGLPVSARPDTVGYRASRFLRRHWLGVSATSALVISLTIGLAVAVVQADRLRVERDRTLQVNQFLQDILVEADPFEAGADTTVRDLLGMAGTMIDQRFADQPDLEATLRLTIGKTQLNLMQLDPAQRNLERAAQLSHQLYGPSDNRTLTADTWLAWLAYRQGHLSDASARYRSILDRLGPGHSWTMRAETLNEYAITLIDNGQLEQAQQAYEQALELWLQNDPDNLTVAILYSNIAGAWRSLDGADRAIEGYRQALELMRTHFPDGNSPYLAAVMTNLAVMLQGQGEVVEAIELYRESLLIRQTTLGDDHVGTGMGHVLLARALLVQEQTDQARSHVHKAMTISTEQLNPYQLQVLLARAALGRLLYQEGNHAAAIAELAATETMMIEHSAPARHIEEVEQWLAEAIAAANRQSTDMATPES